MNFNSTQPRFWLLTIAALVTFVVTLNLGLWQLNRAKEKQTYQNLIEQQAQRPALEAANLINANNFADILHRKVNLTGRWLEAYTLFLDNRQMQGKPGFFVLTPFQFTALPSGLSNTVLVQRGWVPRNFIDRTQLPAIKTATGEITLAGRVALAPSRLYEFDNADQGKIRQNVSIAALSKEFNLRLLEFSILQMDSTSVETQKDGLLRNWLLPNMGVDKHYGYMFQWWALSALTLVLYLWFQVIRPSQNKANKPAI